MGFGTAENDPSEIWVADSVGLRLHDRSGLKEIVSGVYRYTA